MKQFKYIFPMELEFLIYDAEASFSAYAAKKKIEGLSEEGSHNVFKAINHAIRMEYKKAQNEYLSFPEPEVFKVETAGWEMDLSDYPQIETGGVLIFCERQDSKQLYPIAAINGFLDEDEQKRVANAICTALQYRMPTP